VAHATNIPGQSIAGQLFSLCACAPASRIELDTAADWALSDADRLVGRLAGEGGRLPNPHILIRPFVQREAGIRRQ
jgi:translation initiation factor 2 gamma subunit (eIF-2gamma)